MGSTLEMVDNLSDTESIQVVQELFDNVFTQVDYDAVIQNSIGRKELQDLLNIDDLKLESDLPLSESVRLSRMILQHYAADPGLSLIVKQACEKVKKKDDLVVGVILAVGLVVNLTLLIASTSVTVEKGPYGKIRWKIENAKSDPELIKAIIEPVAKIATSGSG